MSSIKLLLLGKTGNGKSATGNAILGREAFETSASGMSCTAWVNAQEYVRFNGRTIKVIDTPGLADTEMKPAASNIRVHDGVVKAFLMCPDGFNALLLILKYSSRYTSEEKGTVATLKQILGDGVLKQHCIIIFTYGELLDIDHGGLAPRTVFESWLSGQEGDLGKLIKECTPSRCILFRNKKCPNVEEQREELLTKVESMQRYTNVIFHRVGAIRKHFILEQKGLLLKGDVLKKCSFLEDSMAKAIKVLGKQSSDTEAIERSIGTMYNDAHQTEKSIEEIDKDLKVLSQLHNAMSAVLKLGNDANASLRNGSVTREKVKEDLQQWKGRLIDCKKQALKTHGVNLQGLDRVLGDIYRLVNVSVEGGK